MSNIYTFGDSFTAIDSDSGWTLMVADALNMNLVNQSISGGSTETAFIRFSYECLHNKFSDGDIIIFQMSTPGRLHFRFQRDRPETASLYLHNVDTTLSDHSWYKENENFIKWYIVNYDPILLSLNYYSYIHALYDFASANPNITVVLLESENQRSYQPYAIPLQDAPSNLLHPSVYLNEIAVNEFTEGYDYLKWTKNTKIDARVNHMTVPNLKIMANSIIEMIRTKDITAVNLQSFSKHVISEVKNKQQYLQLVNDGLLWHNENRLEMLKT